MVSHAESIVFQSNLQDNDWWWARGEKAASLQEAIEIAKPSLLKRESSVRTSTLAYFVKKLGDVQVATSWLREFKAEIEKTVELVQDPLEVIVGMHTAMLKRQSAVPTFESKKSRKCSGHENRVSSRSGLA